MQPSLRTRFILIEPSHAGNVGATARAMKVMGFGDLVLVKPRWANVLRREETIQRASGALDVLRDCRVVEALDEAVEGLHILCATAMTPRDFGPPSGDPRSVLEDLIRELHLLSHSEQQIPHERRQEPDFVQNTPPVHQGETAVGFLFGTERFGMKNEDVYRCHRVLTIPTHPDFGSLNLAAAVQVIAYEWRMALGGFSCRSDARASSGESAPTLADAKAVSATLAHLEQALVHLEFLDPSAPKKLMPRLNALLNRAQIREEEVHIVRGIAKAILQATPKRYSAANSKNAD